MSGTDPSALDAEALALKARAASIRITTELSGIYAERLTASVLAALAARDAEAACAEPDETVKKLTEELVYVKDRAALASAVVRSPDVSARLSARVSLASCAEEAEALSEALEVARATASGARATATAARREADKAAGLAAEAAEALRAPLTHPLAEETRAYNDWMISSGLWWLDTSGPLARAVCEQLLGPTGVGRQLQEDAIRAYLAGDPLALALGGTDRLADGRTVTRAPGRPSLVSRPRLSGPQAAEAAESAARVPPPPHPAVVDAAWAALDAGRLP